MCWQPLLFIVEKGLQCADDSNLQMLLKSYISLIGACGVTEVFDARDAFLGSLCRECVTILKDNQQKEKTPAA